MKILINLFAAFAAIALLTACTTDGQQATKVESCDKKTPFPLIGGIVVPPKEVIPEKYSRFLGFWTEGRWSKWGFNDSSGPVCTSLVVIAVRKDGTAHTIYSWGSSSEYSTKAGWSKRGAKITGNKIELDVFRSGSSVSYVIDDSGPEPILKGLYEGYAGWENYVTLKKKRQRFSRENLW